MQKPLALLPTQQHTIEASAYHCLNFILYLFCPPTSTPLSLEHTNVEIIIYIFFAHPSAHHQGISTPKLESFSMPFLPTHQHTIEASAHQCLYRPLHLFCPPTSTPSRLQHTNGKFILFSFYPTHQHTIEASAHQSLYHPLYLFCPPTSTPSRLQHTNV